MPRAVTYLFFVAVIKEEIKKSFIISTPEVADSGKWDGSQFSFFNPIQKRSFPDEKQKNSNEEQKSPTFK
jgi:hypothetical protein